MVYSDKILLCTHSFKTGRGGIASYAHDFISMFPAAKFFVVTGDDYIRQDAETFDIENLNPLDFSTKNAVKFLKLIHSFKPELIINNYFPLLSLITPYIADGIKIISISHFVNGKHAWIAGFNNLWIDHIISLSTFGKSYLIKKFHIKDESKISVIYNHAEQLSTIGLEEKKQRSVLKIVYPGGCSYAKSAEIVCLALKFLLHTSLDFEFYWLGNTKIAGGYWHWSKTRYISDCIDRNDPRIRHMGTINREGAKAILSEANIFLLPSRGEGCPISLIEAMCGGCIPIISDAEHGSLDLIGHKINGFVVRQGSAKAIVRKITDIILHHKEYRDIYDNNIRTFAERLSPGVWARQMQQLMDTPLKHRHRLPFSKWHFRKNKYGMSLLFCYAWIRERFIQLYHFLCFRYLRYCVR